MKNFNITFWIAASSMTIVFFCCLLMGIAAYNGNKEYIYNIYLYMQIPALICMITTNMKWNKQL